MQEKHMDLFDRFTSSLQEPVRLSIALNEFFSSDLDGPAYAAYAAYIKRRLGPAVDELVEREDLAGLEALRKLGWLDRQQVEEGIAAARHKKRIAALVWLLQIKGTDHGYHDKDFSL